MNAPRFTKESDQPLTIDLGNGQVVQDRRPLAKTGAPRPENPQTAAGDNAQATGSAPEQQPLAKILAATDGTIQRDGKTFVLGHVSEDHVDNRNVVEKLQDFVGAAIARATNPEQQTEYIQGQLQKIIGIGEGLNIAKEETKGAAALAWKALNDGTVANFLRQPNAINDPLFAAVGNMLQAMENDPNATNEALEKFGKALRNASERYSAMAPKDQGHVIGETMFGMINPAGDTEGAQVAMKIADGVATNVDAAVMNNLQQLVGQIEKLKTTAPELAKQTEQFLGEYAQALGLNKSQLQAAGIPGYMQADLEKQGYFAMSSSEDLGGSAEHQIGKAPSPENVTFQEVIDKDPGAAWSADIAPEVRQGIEDFKNGKVLDNGLKYGESAKNLRLEGKDPAQIEQELLSKGFEKHPDVVRDPVTKNPIIENGKPIPMDVYTHADGSMVRIKPEGHPGGPRPQPHASVSVRIPPDGSYQDFGKEGFKVDAHGNPMPKWGKDLRNPYPANTPEARRYADEWANTIHINLG